MKQKSSDWLSDPIYLINMRINVEKMTDLRGSSCFQFGPHLLQSDPISAESEPNTSFLFFLGISACFRQSG